MTRDRLSQVLKLLPVVQVLGGLAIGAGTALAAGAIYKASIDNEVANLKAHDVEQDATIREVREGSKTDHDILMRVDENVKQLLKK